MSSIGSIALVVTAAACVALAASGCVSQAQAKAQAQAAFVAGQRQALAGMQQAQPQRGTVRINGQVRQPVLPWVPGMTLASALVAAEYAGPDPTMIYIARAGRAVQVHPTELLSGKDIQLLEGDVVQISTDPVNAELSPAPVTADPVPGADFVPFEPR